MHLRRRREINRIAEKVRAALELDEIPFPVDDAVDRLGGTVEDTSGDDFEAMVQKRGDDSFRIVVSEQGENRRRFCIAHEIGHLFLHMGYIVDPEKWDGIDEYKDSPKYRFGFSEEEYEAHEFAAALLMPETEFRKVVKKNTKGNQVNLEPVASHFKVSTQAAKIRGQWLGMFEWND